MYMVLNAMVTNNTVPPSWKEDEGFVIIAQSTAASWYKVRTHRSKKDFKWFGF